MAMLGGYELDQEIKVVKGGGGIPGGNPDNTATGRGGAEENDDDFRHALNCIEVGENYRSLFKPDWDEIENQIACKHPDAWKSKQDWQSKVYLGLQAKTSEVGSARGNKLLFPRNFFNISGVEESDKEIVSNITTLIQTVLNDGGFYIQNPMVIQEAVDIGTAALKYAVEDKKRINFWWRSPLNFLVDPSARHDPSKMKFWIDCYERDLGDIIEESRKKNGLYKKEWVQKLIDDASASKPSEGEALTEVRSLDGTSVVQIPESLRKVTLHECWIEVKKPKKGDAVDYIGENDYTLEKRVITIANKKWKLRDDENPYGFIPVKFVRLKKRKYDFYGRGYLFNTRDIQNLINSVVNLGMDSLVLHSMDIIKLNVNQVDDANSIEYKPLAIWKLRDVKAAELSRGEGVSALLDVLRGAQFLDQMHQDVSGVSRQTQGATPMLGQKGEETLGEYQSKLQMVEERFLGQLTPVEQEYVIPLLKDIYTIISNPKLFSQKAIDDILGDKEIPVPEPTTDPTTGMPMMVDTGRTTFVRRLEQKDLSSRDFSRNFIAVGVTSISDNMEALARIQKFIMLVMADPEMRRMVKMDRFLKQVMHALQFPDADDIIRSADELKNTPPPMVSGQTQAMAGMPQAMRTPEEGMVNA